MKNYNISDLDNLNPDKLSDFVADYVKNQKALIPILMEKLLSNIIYSYEIEEIRQYPPTGSQNGFYIFPEMNDADIVPGSPLVTYGDLINRCVKILNPIKHFFTSAIKIDVKEFKIKKLHHQFENELTGKEIHNSIKI